MRENQTLAPRYRQELFGHRYPDFMSWLDDNVWELDIETEIHEPLQNFRSSLRHQAQVFHLNLATRVVIGEDGRKKLLVQSRPSPEEPPQA